MSKLVPVFFLIFLFCFTVSAQELKVKYEPNETLKKITKVIFGQNDNIETVLYDQTSGTTTGGPASQDFETANDPYDNQAADDFTVTGNWSINQVVVGGIYFNGTGPSLSFHVYFYSDNGGMPGAEVYSGLSQPYAYDGTSFFTIFLNSPAVLSAGDYWVSVQSRMDFSSGGQFAWRTVTGTFGSEAQWQNPGDGFASGCTSWGPITGCNATVETDLSFSLHNVAGPGLATNPNPVNGATGVTVPGTTLSWTNPAGATSNSVYFGANPLSLTQIHTGSLVSSIPVSGMTTGTQYYWRVDETDLNGTTTGLVWTFATTCGILTAPWTEDFEAGMLCWSVSGTSGLWADGAASGYGNGLTSAMADFYNVPTGSSDLISADYDASSLTSPALKFDWAYSAYDPTLVDTLKIYYSTNGGTNWTELTVLIGGLGSLNPFQLQNTSPYVPADNEWSTMSLLLPTGTNKVKFTAITDFGNNLYVDNVKIVQALANDAGTISVDMVTTYPSGIVVPQATVKNFGTAINTFNVQMTIGGYSSTKTVTSLAPGASQQVTFDNWNPSNGYFTVDVCTQLGTDGDPSNDCKNKIVGVYGPEWSSGSVMPDTTYLGSGVGYVSSTEATDYLFSIGGNTSSGLLTECYEYNVNTNTWAPIAPLPAGRRVLATAIVGDFLYAIGGSDAASVYQTTVYKYDIALNSWSTVAPLPIAIGWGKAVGYNNRIYFAGGVDGASNVLSSVYVYDVSGDSWTAGTSLPSARFGGAFSVTGNKLVYVAGADIDSLYSTTFVGTIDGGNLLIISWATAKNYPGLNRESQSNFNGNLVDQEKSPGISNEENIMSDGAIYPPGVMYRYDAAPWGTDGIIVAGGSPTSAFLPADPNPCFVYMPDSDTWTSQGVLPIPVLGASMGSVNDGSTWKLIVATGLDDGLGTNATQIYTDDLGGGATTFNLTVNVANSWNMVSAPGLHPVDQNVTTWWSGKDPAASVFRYSGGYSAVTTTTPTQGYWMKNVGAQTYVHNGVIIVAHDPIAGATGWNLIGPYDYNALTSGITTVPAGQVQGSVFGYAGGYFAEDTLKPGYGYWIKLGTAAQIVLPSSSFKGVSKIVNNIGEDWGKIIITDASGKGYTLYAVNGKADLNMFELPPAPPSGVFDVRYGSGRYAEDINESSQQIEMNGMVYPVTVRAEGINIRLQDETGRVVNERLKSGEKVTINHSISKLLASKDIIPDKYSLEQNYPNPFNPSTVIEFSIPENAKDVSLTIYNALGEKVAEVVNGSFEAGVYEYQWNAVNLASGLYIYELRTEKFVSVKKMMLMK